MQCVTEINVLDIQTNQNYFVVIQNSRICVYRFRCNDFDGTSYYLLRKTIEKFSFIEKCGKEIGVGTSEYSNKHCNRQ